MNEMKQMNHTVSRIGYLLFGFPLVYTLTLQIKNYSFITYYEALSNIMDGSVRMCGH